MTNAQSHRRAILLALAVAAAVVTVRGWQLFYFETDDAYIAFRYVSNSLAGRGLVWNPAPFRPVEGYTSFLWVIVLREVWQLAGVEPPDAANVLSLVFGLATLVLGFRFVLRLRLPRELERWRLAFLGLTLLYTLTNRTFFAWLSSGLETSLFNFLFTWWLFEGTARDGRGTPGWLLRLTTSAALGALCRPDGLLFVAATAIILIVERPSDGLRTACCLPLALVPVHLLWRHAVYGYWLPNTYYAKYGGAWPEAGLRYLGCFALENGVWWWALAIAAGSIRRTARDPVRRDSLVRFLPVLVVLFHVGYYTLLVGGDHFEYRMFSYLIPLLPISMIAWLAGATRRGGGIVAALLSFLLVAWPIPWIHWLHSRDKTTRKETFGLKVPVAPYFPQPLRGIVGVWDRWQCWLFDHGVGVRHQEHKVFAIQQAAILPTRAEGMKIPWSEHDVFVDNVVGVAGWVLPDVAIIDKLGLNDRVVAHLGRRAVRDERLMAHELKPPAGYVECYRPNVVFRDGLIVRPRPTPLTDADIRDCESRDWAR